MSEKYPMIVTFTIKDENMEFMKDALFRILEPTRSEEGCLLYELHEDINNKNKLVFYEVWETKKHWQMHDSSKHIQDFLKETNGYIEKVVVENLRIL